MTDSTYSSYRWCDSSGSWHDGHPGDTDDCTAIQGSNDGDHWDDCTASPRNDPWSGGEDTIDGDEGHDGDGNEGHDGDGNEGHDDDDHDQGHDGSCGNDTVAARDGYVDGTAGGDLINGSYTDPNGDKIDANDALLPGAGPNDDYVRAGDGNDTVASGAGNDLVFGGKGDDRADGGDGNDTLYGEAGNDTLSGGVGNNAVYGGSGNDQVDGGSGNDVLHGGDGNDTITAGNGQDTIDAGAGSDLVYGGPGNDLIDTGSDIQRPDIGYPGLYPADTDPNDDKDTVYGGSGSDTIRTGDDADVIHANEGNDSIDAGVDNDTVFGDAGDDTIVGAEGSDCIDAGSGDDVVYGGYGPGVPDSVNIPDATDQAPNNGRDFVDGGQGNDTIFGMDDKDTLVGGQGNDVIDGGIDDDLIDGGQNNDRLLGGDGNDTVMGDIGNDTITGGAGADSLLGGNDRDVFIGGGVGDAVDGNEGGNDFDTLDLTGAGPFHITYDPLNPENGTVTFLDPADHHPVGTMTFQNIENVIPCFTPGTLIATPRGEVAVEDLRVGDRVITRDNGMQEVRWLGRRDLSWNDLASAPHLKPILVRQGSLGEGLPERDMLVSPNHRLLVTNDRTALYFDEHEVLVAAKHLTAGNGIHSVDAAGASYIHFMCDRHEVVLSNGAWSESFQPGDMTLKGMGNSQRSEIFDLFPELKTDAGLVNYQAARKTLKRHEAALLVR